MTANHLDKETKEELDAEQKSPAVRWCCLKILSRTKSEHSEESADPTSPQAVEIPEAGSVAMSEEETSIGPAPSPVEVFVVESGDDNLLRSKASHPQHF